MKRRITRILVANRGEIAVRVIRACREHGLKTVAVFSEADQGALHVRIADERVLLKGSQARDTYLNISLLIQAALITRCDAVHPGYGFLSENEEFATAVEAAGLIFIGPRPETIALMGDKHRARVTAEQFGFPIVPGSGVLSSAADAAAQAKLIGYPVLLKAVSGGSGRGMRVVETAAEMAERFSEVQREAMSAFADDKVILEKYLDRPRHIEVQVFGDGKGGAIHFFERDCSVQRRRQKLIEEAPAPGLHPSVRSRLLERAQKLIAEICYRGAGTIECLVDGGSNPDDPFYFLEMNTRIQVEHTVTEFITGVDLVGLQLHVAEHETLPYQQADIVSHGHALQFRIYAEDIRKNFQPATGKITYLARPGGVGIREDTWVEVGTRISPYYDSLLSKLCVWGENRTQALKRASAVLHEYWVEGLPTTLPLYRSIVVQHEFFRGGVDIRWLERTGVASILSTKTQREGFLPQYAEGFQQEVVVLEKSGES